jgi:HB1, ASXL, restriction endonuclease HTH domain
MHMAKKTTAPTTTRTKIVQGPRTAKLPKAGKNSSAVPILVEAPSDPDAKPAGSARKKKGAKREKLSALSAAAQVLAARGEAMSAPELIAAMAEQKLWTSPNGKTPANTLYAAILREIAIKGRQARFRKMGRGKFATAG